MRFSFGHSGAQRELERVRAQIARVREHIATLQKFQETMGEPVVGEGEDAYSAVHRFRIALTQRDLDARQQELETLLERASALEQAVLGHTTGEFDLHPAEESPTEAIPTMDLVFEAEAPAATEPEPEVADETLEEKTDTPEPQPSGVVAEEEMTSVEEPPAVEDAGAEPVETEDESGDESQEPVAELGQPAVAEEAAQAQWQSQVAVAADGAPATVSTPDGASRRRSILLTLAAVMLVIAAFTTWIFTGGRLGGGSDAARPPGSQTAAANAPAPVAGVLVQPTVTAIAPTTVPATLSPSPVPPTPIPPTVAPPTPVPTELPPTEVPAAVDAVGEAPGEGTPEEETVSGEAPPVEVVAPPPATVAPRPPVRTARIYAPGFGGVYLRSLPSVEGRILRTLSPGTVVELIGGPVPAGGTTWQQVRALGQLGWVTTGTLI